MLSCGLIIKPEIWPMSSNHCSLGQYLRLPPCFEGKVFYLHVLSILHIYFSFICQLVRAIDHNLWESCISLLEKLERKAHSKHIQELWNPTRNFFISLKTEVLNFCTCIFFIHWDKCELQLDVWLWRYSIYKYWWQQFDLIASRSDLASEGASWCRVPRKAPYVAVTGLDPGTRHDVMIDFFMTVIRFQSPHMSVINVDRKNERPRARWSDSKFPSSSHRDAANEKVIKLWHYDVRFIGEPGRASENTFEAFGEEAK